MEAREYNRQLTKLSNGNRNVLSTPWEEAGKMDPTTYQVASAATTALMTVFLSVEELRRLIEHAGHVMSEFHVGEIDPPTADELKASASNRATTRNQQMTTEAAAAAAGSRELVIAADEDNVRGEDLEKKETARGQKDHLRGLHTAWKGQLDILYSHSTQTVACIESGLEEMMKRYSASLRSVEPIAVLKSARDRVVEEMQREMDEKCGPTCCRHQQQQQQEDRGGAQRPATAATSTGTPRGGADGVTAKTLTPRVPSAPVTRPWSSRTMSARVAEAIRRSGTTTNETAHLLNSAEHMLRRPQTARSSTTGTTAIAVGEAGSSTTAAVTPRPSTTTRKEPTDFTSPRAFTRPGQHKEHSRVQVIKRTNKEAKELLAKFDVATVVPCTSAVAREAICQQSPRRTETTTEVPTKHSGGERNLMTELEAEAEGVHVGAVSGGERTTTGTPRIGRSAGTARGTPPRSGGGEEIPVSPPRVIVPHRVDVPPIEATAVLYAEKYLPRNPETVEEKASAILTLKYNKSLYRSLKVDERQIVLDHERKEQLYHHRHTVFNMKICGGEFVLKKAREVEEKAVDKAMKKGDTGSSSGEGRDDEEEGRGGGKDVLSVQEAEDRLRELHRQKKHLEEERARDVKTACMSLTRHKRNLPQVH